MLDQSEIITYASASLPQDDTTVSGGAINTGVVLPQNASGVFIPSESAPEDTTIAWYYKAFKKNTNLSYDMLDISFYVLNGLTLAASAGTVSVVSDSPLETGVLRVYGYYNSGTPGYEDISISGTSTIPGSLNWDVGSPIRAQVLSTGGAYALATGNITVAKGATPLGMIPSGQNCVTAEFEIATDAGVNYVTASTNRLTAPAGLMFALAVSEDTSIGMPGAVPLMAGEAIGVWYKMNRYHDIPGPVDYVFPILRMRGYSS